MVVKFLCLVEGWMIFNVVRKLVGVREMVDSWLEVKVVGWDMRNLVMGVFLMLLGRLVKGV